MPATASPAPRRARADAERNRRRILDAATRVFADSGPTATVNDVARAAGVGIGTVYRKFPDKEALLDALFEEKIDTVMRVASEASQLDEPGTAFRSYLLGMIEVHVSDRSLATVLYTSDRVHRFPPDLAERLASTADTLIAHAIDAGELRSGFTRQDTTVLAVMVRTIATATRESSPDLWRRYAQIVVDGTRPGVVGELAPGPAGFVDTVEALGRTL